MSWFIKIRYGVVVVGLLGLLMACSDPTTKANGNSEKVVYFDLPSYFQKEIDSLKKLDPVVEKTVAKDEQEETKKLKIKDWEAEFASFKNIDLNKSAYAEFIQVDSSDNLLEYSFNDPKSDLSCVRIELDGTGNPKVITVQRDVKNNLYHTSEFLMYEKGKYYIVEKNQDVKVMGANKYKVQGHFGS